MIGSSCLMVLWMFAATPGGAAADVEKPLGALARSIRHDNANYDWPRQRPDGRSQAPLPPRPSPYDSLLGKVDESEAVATDGDDEEAGIPGLPSDEPAAPLKDKAMEKQTKPEPPKPDAPPAKSSQPENIRRDQPPAPPKQELSPPETPTRIPPVLESPPPPPPPQSDDVGEALSTDQDTYKHHRFGQRIFPGRGERLRGWFDDVCFEGWLDQGVTVNPQNPADKSNFPVGFNNRANEYQLNQLYLRLLRDVDLEGACWDFGGRVDLLYGTDWSYVAARGLENTRDMTPRWNSEQYGLAMPQCYAEAFCPWGGVSVKLGHFYSILGYESVAATENFFYSHSYARLYAEPYTETGLLAAKSLGNFSFQAGFSRGDNNWEDNNNGLGFLGGASWKNPDTRTTLSFNINSGREQPDPDTNVRTVYSLVLQQRLGKRWESVTQHDFGAEPGAGVDQTNAKWYGLVQYLFYDINERWRAGMRFEWFRDQGGSRVPGANQTADYFELCPGINFSPNGRLTVRSEVRWDWSGTAGYKPFDDGTRANQILWDLDLILRF
jgi:hypothetical protein